jgi:hypothetical protein
MPAFMPADLGGLATTMVEKSMLIAEVDTLLHAVGRNKMPEPVRSPALRKTGLSSSS